MNLRSLIDEGMAKLQGEVGRFLILKEQIYSLPPSDARAALLSKQNELESRATSLLSKAQALKESLSFSSLPSGLEKLTEARALGDEALRLSTEIAAHKTRVNTAVGNSPRLPNSAPQDSIVTQAVKVGLAAFLINWAWRKARGAVL